MQADSTHKSSQSFEIPRDYDFEKSSEANYCCADAQFVGKYAHIRSQLDYTYHKHYSVERQQLHDKLIDRFLKTVVHDRKRNVECEVPLENWIVFTAGPMGAGKGHTMQWLYKHDLFPLDAFVNVDPDAIRQLLPETAHYNHRDDNTAGFLTQKEVGYISEVLSYDSLLKGKNVLVDGSLRNAHWYLEYFRNLREKFPIIKIGILHVTARPDTVLLRARNRAAVTGRFVPEETILESMRKIPESLAVLSRHAEFVATFLNEDEEPEPRLGQCCMQERVCDNDCFYGGTCDGGSDKQETSDLGREDQQSMRPLWCIQEQEQSEDVCRHHGASSPFVGENSDADLESLRSCSMCYETFHRQNSNSLSKQQNTATGGTTGEANGAEAAPSDHGNINPHNKHHVYKLTELAPTRVCLLDSWKDMFSRVWEMKCAIPTMPVTPAGVTVPVAPVGGSSPRSFGYLGSLRTTVQTNAITNNIAVSGHSAVATSPRLSAVSGASTNSHSDAGGGAGAGNGLGPAAVQSIVNGESIGKHAAARVVALGSDARAVEPDILCNNGAITVGNGKSIFCLQEPAQAVFPSESADTAHTRSKERICSEQHECSEHMSTASPSKKPRLPVA